MCIVIMVKEGGKIDQYLDLIVGLSDEDYNLFKNMFNDVFVFCFEEFQLGFLKMFCGIGLCLSVFYYNY